MTRAITAWGPATLWAAVLFVLSAQPDVPGPGFPFGDKIGHLGLYGILGVALAWGARRWGAPGRWRWIALGALYGASDEWHQSFVPGRDAAWGDFIADVVGVTFGVLIFTNLVGRRGASDPSKEPS